MEVKKPSEQQCTVLRPSSAMRKVRGHGTGLRPGKDCFVTSDMFPRRLVYHFGRRFIMQTRKSKLLSAFLIAGLLGVASIAPVAAQNKSPEGGSMPKVGDVAPDFTLKYFDGKDLKEVSLAQYRGKKNVVVAFFVFAFTGG
jgi:hypothetical protein